MNGLSGEGFDQLRRSISETMRSQKIVSVAVAAAKDGEIVWKEAFGWTDREKQVPGYTPVHLQFALDIQIIHRHRSVVACRERLGGPGLPDQRVPR